MIAMLFFNKKKVMEGISRISDALLWIRNYTSNMCMCFIYVHVKWKSHIRIRTKGANFTCARNARNVPDSTLICLHLVLQNAN